MIERLYTAPPEGSVVVCLDEMGPQSARSYLGRRVVKSAGPKAQRAKQEIDYGRRGKGYVFGAFRPATGDAFTKTYAGRTTANWVDFLGQVEGWINAGVERVYAVMDNLNLHSATDVLLFALAHPRWEFVFQPKYAAYLNLIEPWWKILRSLVLKGRRFEAWPEIEEAVRRATAYWNEHQHPFVWGRKRRHRIARRPRDRRCTKCNNNLADAPLSYAIYRFPAEVVRWQPSNTAEPDRCSRVVRSRYRQPAPTALDQ